MNKILNLKIINIWSLFRENGVILAFVLLSSGIRFFLPTTATAGRVSVSLMELFIIIFSLLMFHKIVAKKYHMSVFVKRVFLIGAVALFLSIIVSGIHVIYFGRSPIEFIGVLRNLYACILILLYVDSKTVSKNELINALYLFIGTAGTWALLRVLVFLFTSNILPNLAVSMYVVAPSVPILLYLYSKAKCNKIHAFVIFISVSATVLHSITFGLRAVGLVGALSLVAAIIIAIIFLSKREKRLITYSIFISVLLVVMALFTPNGRVVRVGVFRAFPFILNIVQMAGGIETMPEITFGLEEFIPSLQEEAPMRDDETISILDDALIMRANAMRSSAQRVAIFRAFYNDIRDTSFIIGSGQRFTTVYFDFIHDDLATFSLPANAHNFIIEITALFGLIGLIGYFSLMAFIFYNITFRIKMQISSKLVIWITGLFVYAIALLQPAIVGGMESNILIWVAISIVYILNKKENMMFKDVV